MSPSKFLSLPSVVRFLLAMVCLIPLIFSPGTLYPFIVGKVIYAQAMIEISFVLWIVLIMYVPENRPRRSWVILALFAWLGVSLAAGMLGVSFTRSLWSDYARMDGIVGFAHWCVYALMVGSMFRTSDHWRQLLWVIVLTSGVVSAIGVFGHIFSDGIPFLSHEGRLSATLGNAIFLGAYACLSVGFVAGLLTMVQGKRNVLLLMGVGLLNVMVLWFSASRGGLITLAIMVLIFIVGYMLLSSHGEMRQRAIRIVAALTVMILLLVTLAVSGGFDTISRFGFVVSSQDDNSINGRTVAAKVAIKAYAERPLLGYGPQNFEVAWGEHAPTDTDNMSFDNSHNRFLEVMATTGTLGIVAYGILCVLLLRLAVKVVFRQGSDLDLAMAVTLAGYFIVSIVMIDTATFWLYFAILVGYLVYRESADLLWESVLRFRTAMIVGIMLIPALLYVIVQYNGNMLLSSQLPSLDKGEAHMVFHEQHLMDYFPPMANTHRFMLMKYGKVELIADDVDAAIAAEPENWKPLYGATRMYQIVAKNNPEYMDEAEHYLRALEKLVPKSIYFKKVREIQDGLETAR